MQTATPAQNALSTYMRDLSDADVMSAEEERSAACRLAQLRADRWAILLSYPPIAAGILGLVESNTGDDIAVETLEQAKAATECLRAARRVKHERTYTAAMRALSLELSEADRDQIIADMVACDLEAIEAGQYEHLNMSAVVPRRTDTFSRYVRRVRRAAIAVGAARNQFVRKNLRLVVSMARRYGRGRMPLEDLIQEGNLGLMKAVDRFDPARGFRFSTYGAWWIRHAITRALQNKSRDVRLPVHVLDSVHKLAEARRKLEAETGESPTPEMLAEKSGIGLDKLERLERSIIFDQPTSIDGTEAGIEGKRALTLVDESGLLADEELDARRATVGITAAIDDLPAMERDILQRRFGLEGGEAETLREIGADYSLSRERIRQIQERAISTIRTRLASAALL